MKKIFVSSVIKARADRVWAVVRDFNDFPTWHPFIVRSTIEGGRPSDAVGCIRSCHLDDDTRIREQLLSLSDYDYSPLLCRNRIRAGLGRLYCHLKFTPVTDDDQTFAEWSAEFETAPDKEREIAGFVSQDLSRGGLDGLKRHLKG